MLPDAIVARNGASASPAKTSLPYTVSSISIKGNKAVTTDEIRSIMLTTTSSSFLGTGLFGGATRPFIPEDFEKDVSLIRKLYTFKGYFSAAIDTTVVRKGDRRKVELLIRISENQPSRIDTVSYAGLEGIPAELRTRYISRSRVKPKEVFSVENLINERDRSLEFFREQGYALFHPDSVRIKVDTVGLNAGIHYRISLPGKVAYGPINVVVHDPVRKDDAATARKIVQDGMSVTIYGRQKLNEDIFVHSVAYRPGSPTKYSLEQRTLQNFGSTNIFSSISIENDSLKAGNLYTTIHLLPGPKHLIEPKLLVDNRYGPLFVGSSLAYENRNLFGGAEQLRISADYGTQTTTKNSLVGSMTEEQYDHARLYDLSLKANLAMPVLKKQGAMVTTTAEYSQSTLPVLLRSRKEVFRASYSTPVSRFSRLNFDFFEIEIAQKDSLRGFRQLFKTQLARNIGIDPNDPGAVNRGIDSLLQRRISQIFRLRYDYSNRTAPAWQRKTVWNISATAEESGSLFWLVDKYIDRTDHAGFTDEDPQIFGTAYSQYLKLDTQAAFAREVAKDRQIAGRLSLGWMSPYGKSNTTPEEHRFYAGGSNSMRGWPFNTLGPGSSASRAASNFGADIKLELGMEYRMTLFKFLGQPSGITLFSDIGNIWDRKGAYAFSLASLRRDFAWDAGAGLRIGSPIGPFRFDFAWKLHDPAAPEPWQISRWNLRDVTFNFGIGEAF
ncbi:MAG: sorting and assembly machinery component 50 [Chlorobiaceae bacterium]|nr:sorting and assembly machinery component 50 [Chlorobiaceae bacterium]